MKPVVVFGFRAPGLGTGPGGAKRQHRDFVTVSRTSRMSRTSKTSGPWRAPRDTPSSGREKAQSRLTRICAVPSGVCTAASPAPTFKLGKFVDENFIPLALLTAASFGYDAWRHAGMRAEPACVLSLSQSFVSAPNGP